MQLYNLEQKIVQIGPNSRCDETGSMPIPFFPSMVNFANILRTAFCTKRLREAFLYLNFSFVLYWRKNISEKAEHKMLMKLTPGVTLQWALAVSVRTGF